MARFAVEMHKLEIMEHPDADRLEVARVLGYRAVVPKGVFKTGDVAAYIPEQSIVPNAILGEMGLAGKLAGKDGNRVRAQRLRGILSQGLVYAGNSLKGRRLSEGDDVTDLLGVKKWEPPIPSEMKGALERYGGDDKLVSYDVENVEQYPGRIREGEQVVMHEKVHGSMCYMVVGPDGITVSSKGRASSQLVFAGGVDNIYTRMRDRYEYELNELAYVIADGSRLPVHLLCEVYGRKVQDLHYGTDLDIVVFDAMLGGKYEPQSVIGGILNGMKLKHAPLVYTGAFSQKILEEHASGRSLIPGADHIREGVVVRPVPEREDMDGRVMLKSLNGEYLCRKGGTEYN